MRHQTHRRITRLTTRTGAGNIGADDTPYGDGEIVRTGAVGDHGDGAFSTGRGGAANIGSPKIPATGERKDEITIPETALRASSEGENFHTGRGGAGNEVLAEKVVKHPVGLADKLKNKLFKKKVAKEEGKA